MGKKHSKDMKAKDAKKHEKHKHEEHRHDKHRADKHKGSKHKGGKHKGDKKAKMATSPNAIEALGFCPCCSKHCPLSKPKCSKGRKLAAKLHG